MPNHDPLLNPTRPKRPRRPLRPWRVGLSPLPLLAMLVIAGVTQAQAPEGERETPTPPENARAEATEAVNPEESELEDIRPRPLEPRYLRAIRRELRLMGLDAACDAPTPTLARCSLIHVDLRAEREIPVYLVYSDGSDTIYFYAPRLALAPPDAESTPSVLRRAMELNWRLLGARLEWNPSSGELRLSAVQHTDSNFDRRAFRSLLGTLLRLVERYGPELERISLAEP
ncbi:MAG: CesT family type III secretion system chaperone [Myxococcales bacterium]|nr:CesT family type III secretion system chaperone [Myxococcales bacterium]